MDPSQLTKEQLQELVGQVLSQIRLTSSASGRTEPDAGPPAIRVVEDEEEPSTLTIEEVPAEEPQLP